MDSLETIQEHAEDTTHSAAHTEEHGEGSLFTHLLNHLRDTHEIEIPGGHITTPYWIYDGGKIYSYRNEEALTEENYFTVKEIDGNHIVYRTADNQKPDLDFSITKHVVFVFLAAFLLAVFAIAAARRNTKNLIPKGLGNIMELFIEFIRDEVALPNMGVKGLKYLPYLLTTFFFILMMNLLGLFPFGASATGNVNVTLTLAVIAFFMIQISAIKSQGIGHYLAHLTGGVHWLLWPIMIPIEIIGLFTKPFALCIRLFANMTAGHIVIVSLIGLTFLFKSYLVGSVSVLFVSVMSILELFVAFLQAYVFTMLTAVFMGFGIMAGHHDEGHEEHSH